MGRARRPKHLDERFEWYADAIEAEPVACAGHWAERHFPQAREVRLDLGCGKGAFVLASAAAEPGVLFVGMDCDRTCVAMAAKAALAAGLPNAVFCLGDAGELPAYFASGELGRLHLNFCTPWPPTHDARQRLTHAERLVAYRPLLAPGAELRFRTDSVPLFEWSLPQFPLAGYDVIWQTADLHAAEPGGITTEYERRLSEAGALIHALAAVPSAGEPPCAEAREAGQRDIPQSLASYLPDDLESLAYVPYGMEDTVRNLRNYRAKQARRAARAAAGER